MHLRAHLLVALCIPTLARAAFDPRPVEQALDELRYADARRMVDQALQAGGHDRAELAELYLLSGEIAAVLDGADAGEREFRKLLVIEPEQPLARRTPVFAAPFARAKEWVRANGQLAASAQVAPGPPPVVEVKVANDPLAMFDHARLLVPAPSGAQAIDAPALRIEAPADLGAYWVQVLDRAGDVVLDLGSEAAPLHYVPPKIEPPPEQPPIGPIGPPLPPKRSDRRLLGLGLGSGLLSLALLGGGIGFNVAARGEYHQLQTTCAPSCMQSDLNTLHTEENATIGLYTASAIFAAAALAVLILYALR